MTDLRELSKVSGIRVTGLQDAARTMLAFGVETRKVAPLLSRLADIAGGDTERMKGLALAFSQVAALGRLTGEEVNQMVERGFNPLAIMSQRTGELMTSLRKRMQEGQISFAEFESAVISATSAGGRFYGAAAAGNQGLAGSFNKLTSQVELLSTKFGEALAPAASTFIDTLSSGLPVLDGYIDGVGRLAAGFKSAADWAAQLRTGTGDGKTVDRSATGATKPAVGAAVSMAANPIMSMIGTVPDVITGFTSRDEVKNNEANDRLRQRFGRGIFHEDRNKEIDAFMQNRSAALKAEEEKKLAPQREKEATARRMAERQQKETDRANAVNSLTGRASDRMTVEAWNLENPNLKANSADEVKALRSMNDQERMRLEILQSQSALVEKMKDDQEGLRKIIARGNSMGQSSQLAFYSHQNNLADNREKQKAIDTKNKSAADAMRERNMTPAERFKQQAAEVDRLQGAGAIDATTALREKLAIQSQVQQQIMQMQQPVPDILKSGNPSFAKSIQVGSAEYVQYMQAIQSLAEKDTTPAKDPTQEKQLKELQDQLREIRRQTGILEKIADTSPRKIR